MRGRIASDLRPRINLVQPCRLAPYRCLVRATIVTVVRAEAVSGAGNLVTKGAWDIVKAPAARGRSAPVVLCVAVSANLRKSRATVQIRGARSLR